MSLEKTVCILAAGRGQRLRELTAKNNKALLPIDDKAIITHIFEYFPPATKFVVAVSYQARKVKEYIELAHPDLNVTFVNVKNSTGENSGPGQSLLECKPFIEGQFVIWSVDTLLSDVSQLELLDLSENWVATQHVDYAGDYCSFSVTTDACITNVQDKSNEGPGDAFIGVCNIIDYDMFWNSLEANSELVRNERQLSGGFLELISAGKLFAKKVTSWYDVGTYESYVTTRKVFEKRKIDFTFDKVNEYIYHVNGRVIKYFDDYSRVKKRVNRAKYLQGTCPSIIAKKMHFYAYEYIEGKTLYEVLDDKNFESFLSWISNTLWATPAPSIAGFQEACHRFYHGKTTSRLSAFYNKYSSEDFDKKHTINGEIVRPINDLFRHVNWNFLSSGCSSYFHGDLQFDNVVKTHDSFVLLDWREEFDTLVGIGDRYYDVAKLYGGLLVPYDKMKRGEFTFIEDGSFISAKCESHDRYIKKFEKFLYSNGINVKKVKLLCSLIFLSMSPLHDSPFDKFIFYQGKLLLQKAVQ